MVLRVLLEIAVLTRLQDFSPDSSTLELLFRLSTISSCNFFLISIMAAVQSLSIPSGHPRLRNTGHFVVHVFFTGTGLFQNLETMVRRIQKM